MGIDLETKPVARSVFRRNLNVGSIAVIRDVGGERFLLCADRNREVSRYGTRTGAIDGNSIDINIFTGADLIHFVLDGNCGQLCLLFRPEGIEIRRFFDRRLKFFRLNAGAADETDIFRSSGLIFFLDNPPFAVRQVGDDTNKSGSVETACDDNRLAGRERLLAGGAFSVLPDPLPFDGISFGRNGLPSEIGLDQKLHLFAGLIEHFIGSSVDRDFLSVKPGSLIVGFSGGRPDGELPDFKKSLLIPRIDHTAECLAVFGNCKGCFITIPVIENPEKTLLVTTVFSIALREKFQIVHRSASQE